MIKHFISRHLRNTQSHGTGAKTINPSKYLSKQRVIKENDVGHERCNKRLMREASGGVSAFVVDASEVTVTDVSVSVS